MKPSIEQYKNNGKLAVKHMWFVILLFSIVQVIVSIATCVQNSKAMGGYKSASFAAIWTMFLVLIFLYQSGQLVFRNQASKVQVGFLIGSGAMLSELMFVLMCVFFVLGTEASTNNYDTKGADTAFGVFALFNLIIYMVWSIILSVHRHAFQGADEISSTPDSYATNVQPNPSYMNNEKVGQHEDETQDL